jgi:pimeloyl-ACP methyl ester carboxylesterase
MTETAQIITEPAPRNHVMRGYANTGSGQVHYRGVDGAAPAIVFLHQTATSSASFQPVLERLNLPNRLVAIDTPGFGGSFDPPGWPSMGDYAGYILDALHVLGVASAHFVGHHTGGSLALEIAARHPARAESVTLIGPVTMTEGEREEFRAAFDKPISPRPDGSHLVENWNYAHVNNKDCDLEVIHGEVVGMLRAWRGRPQAYRAVSFQDGEALIRGCAAPLLLLCSPGDWFFPRFESVRAMRPDAAAAIIGGDNFPTLVDSAGVADAIERFIGGLSRG